MPSSRRRRSCKGRLRVVVGVALPLVVTPRLLLLSTRPPSPPTPLPPSLLPRTLIKPTLVRTRLSQSRQRPLSLKTRARLYGIPTPAN